MSKRVFPLDTRAGWIEQHHVDFSSDTFIVQREGIYAVGPGDYSPTRLERHVFTPKLGKAQDISSQNLFKFGPHSRLRKNHLSTDSLYSISQSITGVEPGAKGEYATIFHDHDRRQPIDSRQRYTATPGPYLGQESVLESVSYDGKKILKNVDFTAEERFIPDKRESLKLGYDIKYDSEQVKPKARLGFTPSSKRMPIQFGQQDLSKDEPPDNGFRPCSKPSHHVSTLSVRSKSPSNPDGWRKQPQFTSTSFSPVKRPVVKHKYKQEILFDSSCYSDARKDLDIDISPGVINKLVKSNTFGSLLLVPKVHSIQQQSSQSTSRSSVPLSAMATLAASRR